MGKKEGNGEATWWEETKERIVRCSFCGKRHDEVLKLFAAPEANICDECVYLCKEILGVPARVCEGEGGSGSQDDAESLSCTFCGKSRSEVVRLIAGPDVDICGECIDLCYEMVTSDIAKEQTDRGLDTLARKTRAGAMKLYLVQHGDALDKEVDPDRPLSPDGVRDVERVAAFARDAGIQVGEIWHSGKTRARQTAERLAEAIAPGVTLNESAHLTPNSPVRLMGESLASPDKDLMLVGHLPHLASLAGLLLTGSEDSQPVTFQKGGIVCLERDEERAWHLAWMITPALLAR